MTFPEQSSGGFPTTIPGNQSPFGPPARSPGRGLGSILRMLGLALFVGLILTIITSVVWPGSMKLFAPLLCSDATPDPFVVVDRYQVRPGETVFTYTLYCVGPTGVAEDIGWAPPFGLLTVTLSLMVFVLLLLARGTRTSNDQRFGISP